jgi:precorrin-2 dehydrogenase/sirohydrochlorin ferrochelatase
LQFTQQEFSTMAHPQYPLLLSVSGVPALVVGAGRVAERKVAGLLRCGARVTVVAPLAARAIRKWSAEGSVRWRERVYAPKDLKGQRLVYCTTDQPDVDARVAREARRRGLLVNCASQPELGNFSLPATARAGDLQVAVSTGGASPVLARRLARQVQAELGRSVGAWAALLRQLRPVVLKTVPPVKRKKLLQALAGERIGRLLQDRQLAEARQEARRLIRAAASRPGKKR